MESRCNFRSRSFSPHLPDRRNQQRHCRGRHCRSWEQQKKQSPLLGALWPWGPLCAWVPLSSLDLGALVRSSCRWHSQPIHACSYAHCEKDLPYGKQRTGSCLLIVREANLSARIRTGGEKECEEEKLTTLQRRKGKQIIYLRKGKQK